MRLVLHVPGADPASLASGLATARAVFEEALVDPSQAAWALHKLEGWDLRGVTAHRALEENTLRQAMTLQRAEERAIAACREACPTSGSEGAWLEVRTFETALDEQVRCAVKMWIDAALPLSLWRVLRVGGLSALIVAPEGLPQVDIVLDGGDGALSRFGVLNPDLPGDEALALFADQCGATEPPADANAQEEWFLGQVAAHVGAWQFLTSQVQDHQALFAQIADLWECA